MNKVATLKAQAKNLVQAMADIGVTVSHSQALEAVAKQYGFDNWDTAAGLLKAEVPARAPRLADMPLVPISAWVERENPVSQSCTVYYYDSEALGLIHDEEALCRFIAQYPDAYAEGLDTNAITLLDDGEDWHFSLRQLLGITYVDLGGNWKLKDGITHLRFSLGDVWKPATPASTGLTVPEMAKSAKGCNLLRLTSHDGADYDKFVIVPPHLDQAVIKSKIDAELTRLKALDAAGGEDETFEEYTDKDVKEFVRRLGCVYVSQPQTVGQNWDC